MQGQSGHGDEERDARDGGPGPQPGPVLAAGAHGTGRLRYGYVLGAREPAEPVVEQGRLLGGRGGGRQFGEPFGDGGAGGHQTARRRRGAGLRLGRGLREVQADPVVQEQRAPVGRGQVQQRVEQRPLPRLRGRGVGVPVRAAQPVPGGHRVLVRRGAHPAGRVPVDGHLGPAVPGQLEGALDGLAGQGPAAGQQIGLPDEAGGGAGVQLVERLGG
ncbi:hypothetical protein ASD97_21825 [Streptomyces sp. Root63]|nr:hypothetical protein ASD97_21825 [Streptomyces sp. Root63]